MNINFHQSTVITVSLLLFVFCASLLVTKPKDDGKQLLRRTANERNVGPPERRLTGYDAVRMGKCSEVPYGNLTWPNEVDIKSLELNELMIHLDHPAYVSPPNQYGANGMGPVIVDIGLYIHQIKQVDVGTNEFFMEGFIDLVWCDTRLKFETDIDYKKKRYYLEGDAAKELEEIWWPDITFVNEVGKRTVENQELIIESDGTIEYREKFAVDLTSNFETREFPFDKQVLTAEIESFAWNATTLEFHVQEDLVGFSKHFSIPEFEVLGIEEHVQIRQEPRDRYPFSDLVTEFAIKRLPGYYVTKVIVPLILIVAISWSVFWMDACDLGDRMAISFTGILTAVAYQFIISDTLPSHVNDTFLDNFILLAFFNLVFTVIINILVHHFHAIGYCDEATLIDKISQILFPALFLIGSLVLMCLQIINDKLPVAGLLGVTFCSLLIVVVVVALIHSRNNKKRQRLLILDAKRESQKVNAMIQQKDKDIESAQLNPNSLDGELNEERAKSEKPIEIRNRISGVSNTMIYKKNKNIEDARLTIYTLEKELNEEKAKRSKLVERRSRISGVSTRGEKKEIAELEVSIKKQEESIDSKIYRISSLNEFIKGQENVREILMKRTSGMVDVDMVDQVSRVDRPESLQEEAVLGRDSEQGTLRRRSQKESSTDEISAAGDR